MEITNTAGTREWLASTEGLNFELEVDLAAYIFEVAGSVSDLDPEFEAAATEAWIK